MPAPNVADSTTDHPAAKNTATSRRALLAGALGGIGAMAATVIGGASRAQAAAGSSLIIGSEANDAGSANTQLLTNSSVVAFKLLQNGPGTALMGYATQASGATRGVYGRTDSPNGFGVQARSAGATGTGAAVQAIGVNNHGVDATTDEGTRTAVRGINTGVGGVAVAGSTATGGIGVVGSSSDGVGVWGTSATSAGVHGSSITGIAVEGISSSSGTGVFGSSTFGYAGSFTGHVRVSQYLDIAEMAEPATPSANTARLFVRDSGGKTQVCAKFSDGSIVVIAAQP